MTRERERGFRLAREALGGDAERAAPSDPTAALPQTEPTAAAMGRHTLRGPALPIRRASWFAAERRAESMLAEAEETAADILRAAEVRATALVESARAEHTRLLESRRLDAAREREAALAASAGDVLSLGLELARRITRHALERDASVYAAMASSLIAEARIDGPGWLRVPHGVALMIEGFETLDDPALRPGDLVVETEGARLDAVLDERLAELARALETPKTS
jgi:hypothetical protein